MVILITNPKEFSCLRSAIVCYTFTNYCKEVDFFFFLICAWPVLCDVRGDIKR